MSYTRIPTSAKTYAKGRNGYFKVGAIEIDSGWNVTQPPDEDQKGVHIEVESSRPVRGENSIVINLLNDEALLLGDALQAASGLGRWIYQVSESHLAYQYDKAACHVCRTGGQECERDHEKAEAYWSLPQARRQDLIEKVESQMDQVFSLVGDILCGVAEEEVPPDV